jgi:lactate dehydrogenase-like 2-hydroxyacid dehydrogenase
MASIIDAAVAKIKPRGYPSKVVAVKARAGASRAEGDETLKDVHVLIPRPPMELIVEGISERFTAHRLWEVDDREAWFREFGPKVRGIGAVMHERIDGAFMDRLPNLEIVSNFGVGYDTVDAREAGRRGVIVTNTPDVLTDEVADLALGLLLATIRELPQADRYLRAGKWVEKGDYPLTATLRNRKVGILGLGRIGKAIARRLEGFDTAISYYGRSRQADVSYPYYDNAVALAQAVDVLIVVTPGGAETRHLVNAEVLKALGPNGILVNVARGSVVDTQALIEALRSKAILTAGLDVFEGEPKVPQELIDMDHVVLLPHVGSASIETRRGMGQLVVDNLVSWFSGKGPVTPVPETPWTAGKA